jgi:hypothetical protein
MIITITDHQHTACECGWTTSRLWCLPVLIPTAVGAPTPRITSRVSASRAHDLYPSLLIGAGSARCATLSFRSHAIQSP